MKSLGALLVLAVVSASAAAREPIRLANNPALSPNGSELAFDWNGDIWTVPTTGGVAKQLTAHPARDTQPKYSPDGKQIAFISDRDGANQVYVMPATGGAPRQLTYHTAGFTLHGWTPDGQKLLVSSLRDHFWRLAERFFLISASKRGPEEMLLDDYGTNGALSPDGKQLLFTREGPAWWRKGYRGSQAGQIWSYDIEKKAVGKLTSHESGDLWPMWKADATGYYFVSGRGGAFDLWEQDFQARVPKQLTRFKDDDSVVFPCISHDGSTIVFRRLFDLYRFKPGTNEPPVKIDIFADADRTAEKIDRRTLSTATSAAFSNDGLEIAMIAGGDLWVMDTELREPKQITATAEEERSPVFSPTGDSILFVSDRDGRSEIYRAQRGDPSKFWWQNDHFTTTRLTQDGEQKSDLHWSPDGSHVAFVAGRGTLCVMTPDGKTVHTVLKSFTHPEFDWSPDGKWLVYSADDTDFNRDIFIIPFDGSKPPVNVSRHPRNDHNPVWSPDGKLIAFTGQRGEERDIFYVWLKAEDEEKAGRDRTIEKAIEKMTKGRKSTDRPADGDAKPETPAPRPEPRKPVVIDWDGLHERTHRIANPNSTETDLFWSPDSKKLLFTATIEGKAGIYSVEIPDDPKPKSFLTQPITSSHWLRRGNQIVGLSNGLPISVAIDPVTGRPKGATAEPAAPTAPAAAARRPAGAPAAATPGASTEGGFRFTALQAVNVPQKNAAVFDLAWRTMRDNYYDEHLGNRDWNKIREKYLEAAGEAPDAEAVGTVVNLMLGELNGSHLGFYPGIRDISQRRQPGQADDPAAGKWRETTAHLGLRFEPDFAGPGLKVRDVIIGGPANQKRSHIVAGEIVLAIDGKPVDPTTDLPALLNGPASRDVVLTVKSADQKERSVTLRPITFAQARTLLYEQWIKGNRKMVDTLSHGTLGYLHIAAMDMNSFYKFEEALYDAGAGKDGLVIDVRENGGGSTADHLLTALTQPVHAIAVPRGGGPGYPNDRKVYATWNKPVVVLCNQNSFSNAEIFSHAIKTLKRGQLVGVPTAGGVISTGGTPIMDAGFLRLPFRGWFTVGDGEDMELHGAVPHHVVWPMPGEMPRGKDKQMEKAVEVLLADVAAWKAQPRPKLLKATERK